MGKVKGEWKTGEDSYRSYGILRKIHRTECRTIILFGIQ